MDKYLGHVTPEDVSAVTFICQNRCFLFGKFESDLIIIKRVLAQVYVRNAPRTANKDDDDAAAADDDDDNDDDDDDIRADGLKRNKK